METKAMLPDSTQSETMPAGTSSAANHPPSTRDGSSGSNSKGKKSDGSKKKKKRKSEERTAKNSKKKKMGKEKSHKEQKSSKKSKKGDQPAKKVEPVEQDSDLDLENEVKPIRDYIQDREEMLQHMFKCVMKADKLQAMLPDILKDVKVEELQQLCLLQLEGMSKSRVMSILAGEEMQSSSDDEESDLEVEQDPSKTEDAEDNLINSEVVDSTSSLPQASMSVADVEEVMSMHDVEEEAAGEEAGEGDSDAEDNAEGEEDDVASPDNSWQDGSERHHRYSDEDQDLNEDNDDIRHHEGESDSVAEMDREEDQEEEIEEETVVQKPKKYRRIKIVRADGEECEEGEITSDEVETDEESVHSSKEADEDTPKPEGDTGDATPLDTHPGADTGEGEASEEPGESVGVPQDVKRSLPNSGNHGNDANNDNVSVDDDSSAHVDMDVSVTKDLVSDDQSVADGAIMNKTTSDGSKANAAVSASVGATVAVPVGVTVGKDIVDNSLNIFAEDKLEMDSEENVVHDSDQECLVEDGDNKVKTNDVDSDSTSDNVNEEKINDENDSESENSENASDAIEHVERKPQTPQPVTQVQGAIGTAKSSGRKVAQELEVLELELRARAIRSLMKQYRKDVG
ncbi:transcription initiation factor TFIID subunit 11-like isoform X2 [Patiria miniata]|uniref:Caspase activity and apoptosis inhibitor 1 n=1 Tax=Patiria miniata TaxID=46514 RepID=A0A914AY50_PATMI|nr:transcription initiation factor TFIID subunit 11-like isoform X2 [Patiria miniata]